MKPTRNIVKPNAGLWTPKHTVWFKKNDDSAKKIKWIKKRTKFWFEVLSDGSENANPEVDARIAKDNSILDYKQEVAGEGV